MTKIMLVEDDKSLREIYGVRLLAEGYEIISAGDGEEALAMAVKEKPDLILSDVMMPKISGFDMLDILRSTPETKDIKVIMMTALSSEDQRSRGETLGANRYLVKSQVGIEDVVRTVHDVLGDVPVSAAPAAQKFGNPVPTAVIEQPAPGPIAPTPAQTPPAPAAPVTQPAPAPSATPPAPTEPKPPIEPAVPQPAPAASTPASEPPVATPEPTPTTPLAPTPAAEPEVTPVPPAAPTAPTTPTTPPAQPTQTLQTPTAPTTIAPATPPAPQPDTHLPEPTAPFSTAAPASLGERVINPPAPEEKPVADIAMMIDQELSLNDGSDTLPTPPAAS